MMSLPSFAYGLEGWLASGSCRIFLIPALRAAQTTDSSRFRDAGFLRHPSAVWTAKPGVEVSGPQGHLLPLSRHAIALPL